MKAMTTEQLLDPIEIVRRVMIASAERQGFTIVERPKPELVVDNVTKLETRTS
jgi:hypothetical protein